MANFVILEWSATIFPPPYNHIDLVKMPSFALIISDVYIQCEKSIALSPPSLRFIIFLILMEQLWRIIDFWGFLGVFLKPLYQLNMYHKSETGRRKWE
jgi:hypothetical protein